YQGGRAPYGYRYVPRHDAVPGYLVIDDAEADLVRTLYGWLIDECMSVRQIVKRLNASLHRPRSGRIPWSSSVVHKILDDPIYAGTAYANRYAFTAPNKPRTGRSPHTRQLTHRQVRPRDEWIATSVPAIVDAVTWERAQAQLTRNATLSFR